MRISGLMMNYYFICKRKLWCFSRNLNFEETNENVKMGKLIDESRYSFETKQIAIEETVNIDFIRNWKVVHEIKKSKAIEEAAIWQVKYYIYFLKIRERKEIILSEEDEAYLEKVLIEIEEICKNENSPEVINDKRCKKCAYYEYCYV